MRTVRLRRGASPAAVGLAAAVVTMSAVVLVTGAFLNLGGPLGKVVGALDSHPGGGLITALFGMGAPLSWKVQPLGITGNATAVGLIGQAPLLLVATAIIAGGALLTGILGARRRAAVASAACFVLFSTAAAMVVSHLRPLSITGGLRAELDISPLATLLVSALWASAGVIAGGLVQRRLAHRVAVPKPARLPHRQLGQGLVAASLTLVVLAGCAGGGGKTLAASGTRQAGPGTTTTTAAPGTTTTIGADSAAAATSTTASAGGIARGGRGGAANTTTTAGGSTPTTAGAAAGTAADTAGPGTAPGGGLAPPTAGTYRYDTTGTLSYLGTRKAYPGVTSLVVDPANGVVQHALRDLGGGADGLTIEQTLDYRPDGIYVKQQRLRISLGALKSSKTMKPTAGGMWLPTKGGPGAHSAFDLTGTDITGHETVDVLRAEKVTLGGQAVDALVVRTVLTFSGGANGRIAFDQWFVRSARVVAKEHLDGDVKASIVRLTTSYDAVLQRLTP